MDSNSSSAGSFNQEICIPLSNNIPSSAEFWSEMSSNREIEWVPFNRRNKNLCKMNPERKRMFKYRIKANNEVIRIECKKCDCCEILRPQIAMLQNQLATLQAENERLKNSSKEEVKFPQNLEEHLPPGSKLKRHTTDDITIPKKEVGTYKYQDFVEQIRLGNTELIDMDLWRRCLTDADRIQPVAYYFYSNTYDLSSHTKSKFVHVFNTYFNDDPERLDIDMIHELFMVEVRANIDQSSMDYTQQKYNNVCRLLKVSYGLHKQDLPIIDFKAKPLQARVEDGPASPDDIASIVTTLKSYDYFSYMIVVMMYIFALSPAEARLLTYENLGRLEQDVPIFSVYRTSTRQMQAIVTDEVTYDSIKKLQLVTCTDLGTPPCSRFSSAGDEIIGHFIVEMSERNFRRLFEKGFGGTITDYKLRPKDPKKAYEWHFGSYKDMVKSAKIPGHKYLDENQC